MAAPQLIGDEIYWNGQLMAIVVNNARGGTVMGEFIEFFEDPVSALEDEIEDADKSAHLFAAALMEAAKLRAKGSLLRLTDLDVLVEELLDKLADGRLEHPLSAASAGTRVSPRKGPRGA
jgi:hypothetical protein